MARSLEVAQLTRQIRQLPCVLQRNRSDPSGFRGELRTMGHRWFRFQLRHPSPSLCMVG